MRTFVFALDPPCIPESLTGGALTLNCGGAGAVTVSVTFTVIEGRASEETVSVP